MAGAAVADPGRSVHRLQLAGICAALTAVAMKSAPGRLVGDTKLDLAIAPGRLMGRALHLWDPSRDFGVTQNQNYGYLFPTGPFFWAGRAIGLPAWAVQRLWWSVLLCVAFLGLVRLAGALGIGTRTSRIIAGLAFALSPRILSTLGPISVESLPYCLAPWVLLPLVRGGSPRRAAARSAAAVLLMGAVNAVAVLAALPPAVLWLLTRARGPARRRLAAWWVACVLLATAWWLVPLLLLGRYSPPFLDYIETAGTTTAVTSLIEVLRGTSDWIAYLPGAAGPTWPAGWALLTVPLAIGYTVVVLLAGLAGLLRRDLPERLWLTACLLLGVAAVTAGHLGAVQGAAAGFLHGQLDGALAPLRNVHKFDVVLRLPLALGLAHLVGRLGAADVRQRAVVTVGAVAAVLGAALPVLSPGLAPRAPFVEIPAYWHQTADWLAQHRSDGAALLLPGSSFPDYLWGSSNDEPLQPLARSRWAVRSAVPLTPPGTIRALDAIEQRLATGRPSPGLGSELRRMGVGYVVVRNDLAYARAGSARPLLVHEALLGSGLRVATSFGPRIGGGINGAYADEGLELRYPSVEVFASGPAPRVELHRLADAVVVDGAPEALLSLADRRLLQGRPVVLAADARGVAGLAELPVALTDTPRRREVAFGRLTDNRSPTLTADDPYRLDAPAHDYAVPGAAPTVARLDGARRIEVSSSASDAGAFGGSDAAASPYAAVDGDPATAWRSDPGKGSRGAFWRIVLDAPRSLRGVRILLGGPAAQRPARVRVTADHDSRVVPVGSTGSLSLDLTGTSRTLTIATLGGSHTDLGGLAVAEVTLPGLAVTRTLVLPPVPRAAVVALNAAGDARRACFPFGPTSPCSSTVARRGEESGGLRRTVRLGRPATYPIRATALPVAGAALDRLLDAGSGVAVTASSSAVADPAGRPAAAYDGDISTGWRAAPGDDAPTLTLRWPAPQTVRAVRIVVAPTLAASHAGRITVLADGRRVAGGRLDRTGLLRLPKPVSFRQLQLQLEVTDGDVGGSVDPATGRLGLLPLGVSEVRVDGAATALIPPATVDLPCGHGPVLTVGDQHRDTALRVSRADLLDRAVVPLRVCGGPVELGASTDVTALSSATLQPVSLTFGADLPPPEAATVPATPVWRADRRTVDLPRRAEASLLQVHENTNPGWRATLDGQRLRPVVLDGWQQGWVVPAGAAGAVHLTYGPDRLYRRALLLGLLLALGLLLLAWRGGSVAGEPAPEPAPIRGWHVTGLAVVLVLIGGPTALVLLVLGVVAARLPVRVATAVPLAAVGAAGALLVLRPWGSRAYAGRGAVTQTLCLIGLTGIWSALVRWRGTGGGRRRQVMSGRSTNR